MQSLVEHNMFWYTPIQNVATRNILLTNLEDPNLGDIHDTDTKRTCKLNQRKTITKIQNMFQTKIL